MPAIRAATARSAIDRELHTHLTRAAKAVRAAMGVCGRASRGRQAAVEASYRDQQKRLARAEKLLSDIGHLEESSETPDMRHEARSLCSWLEGRERSAGVRRPSRRGSEYQSRLQQVLLFLAGGDPSSDETPVPAETPPDQELERSSDGVMWERALELARQQNKADDDNYVLAIFMRLAGGVNDG